MVTCGICHEESLSEIGELDSCDHGFCSACIQQWAQIESKCPFCKARFTTISRKALDLERLPNSDDECDDTLKQRFPGTVLETVQVPERNQVYLGDAEWAGDEGEDPLGDVICMECGQGDDEDNLMLCDGCERACHTYCANLDALPDGDWFCWVCMENGDRQLAGEEAVDTAARRPRRVPSALVASDFTLSRSVRRASSPGAQSELSSRSTRRVRRRLVRSGERLQPGRSGGGTQRLDSDADSILNALERSINARDHAGLSTTAEHRRLAGLRGAWNSVRQGQRPFPVRASRPATPAAQHPVAHPQASDPESQAWAAFDASRRAQGRALPRSMTSTAGPSGTRAVTRSPPHITPASPVLQSQQTASSLARQAIAEARHRGRQLASTQSSPRHLSSSSAATVASQRRSRDRQRDSATPHESWRLEHNRNARSGLAIPRRDNTLQGRGSMQLAGRSPVFSQSSSRRQWEAAGNLQPPDRLRARGSQPPYPPHSPRLRGGDNTMETSNSAHVLPVPYSSRPNMASAQQQQSHRDFSSGAGRPHTYQPLSQSISFGHQQHSQQQLPGRSPAPLQAAAHLDQGQATQPQQSSLHFAEDARLPLNPVPEPPPPLPPGPPPASAFAAPTYPRQAAAVRNSDDSSDSSSSQVASQHNGGRAMPSIRDNTRTGSADATTAAVRAPAAAASGHESAGHLPGMTKQQAADAVKALIKPLYAAKTLSKDQFKAVAKTCTHALAGTSTLVADSNAVRAVICNCLTDMGLNNTVAQL